MKMTKESKHVGRWFRDALKPDPILKVSDWADKYRILSRKAASEPGQWSTKRTPYLKEIMDVLSATHPARKVVFKKASQVGGTECGNNWIGYVIDYAPGPMMLIQPTVDLAKRNSHLRIEPLIQESPRLLDKVSSPRSKDSTNTVLQKDFEGGTLVMTGANSAAGLRSMPARFLMCDEIDAYPHDVEGEGDPVSLVMARSRTFSRRKAFLVSTPTIDGASRIDDEWESSDKRLFFVPCPDCGHFQNLKWTNLQWPEGEPHKASYYCEECGVEIEERNKTQMLMNGKWVAQQPTSDVVGFHLNSLYSPIGWYSWANMAQDYETAKKQQEQEKKSELMKTFVNTALGETYKEPGEAPEWKLIYLRRENYKPGVVPKGVAFLTCGVDVQKDRLELEVVGWGKNKESWSIVYRVLEGNTSEQPVWELLREFLETTFPTEDGQFEIPIAMTCVDSGFNTQHVYNFCRKFPVNRVAPVKGVDGLAVMIGLPKIVDHKHKKKVDRRAVRVWNLGVSLIKAELYGWLRMAQPIGEEKIPSGFCHFPEYDEEYFKQLTAEKVVVRRNRKGFSIVEWVKERERNEALDCRVYNRAAASMVGIDRFRDKDWSKFRVQTLVKLEKPADAKPETNKKPIVTKRKKERESFWGT